MFRYSLILLAAAAALPTSATAGGVPGFRLSPNAVRPTMEQSDYLRASHQSSQWKYLRDWQYQQWQGISQNYAAALRFAQCVTRLNPDAADMLSRPIGAAGDREALARLVTDHRACVGEQSAVSPLLIRAALAESVMGSKMAGRVVAVGVPDMVDGYPLASVSKCLVEHAPASVAAVLKTRPGDEEERLAAQKLFLEVPDCVPARTVRLSPTAARLALIDAVYRQAPDAR